jgi:flagellar basal body-associated protein FliL
MNKKLIIGIVVLLLIFVVGFVSAQVFDINLPFIGGEGEDVEHTYAVEGSILTNIKNSRSFVKTEVVFTVMSDNEVEHMRENAFKIRDLIIDVLRSMEEHEYYTDNLQKVLSERIIERMSNDLGYEYIQRVYFKDLITQ